MFNCWDFRHRDQSGSRSLIRNDKPQQTRVDSLDTLFGLPPAEWPISVFKQNW